MASYDKDPLVKLSNSDQHLDNSDPRLVVGQSCGLRCRPGCSHQFDMNSDVDDSTIEDAEGAMDSSVCSSHCHATDSLHDQHDHKYLQSKAALSRLICVAVLCFLFMTAEGIGGYMADSLAIMSDAAHLLSDFGSFLVSIMAIWLSLRPPTTTMTFGYHRAEVLGAAVSVLVIWLVTGVLVYLAAERVIHGHYKIDADTMLVVAGLGVVVNIIMGAVLHGSCSRGVIAHSHHGHSHLSSANHQCHLATENSTAAAGTSRNINLRAAFIHVLGDFIQSIGVLIAAVIIKFKPEYRVADPICTFIFSVIVVLTTVGVARDVTRILMESTPGNFCYREAVRDLEAIPGVLRVHSVLVWSLNIDRVAFSAHLAKEPSADGELILQEALSKLRSRYSVISPTIQVELYHPLMEHCIHCRQPTV